MPALQEALNQVRARIERSKNSKLNEEQTRYTLVDPLIRALGWDTENIDEVRSQYRYKSNDNPVDYAFLISGKPRLFLEAKALGGNLDDRKWSHQIMGYASVMGVEWIALTDGDKYRIYNSHATVPVEKKLFRSVSITDQTEKVTETLSLLSKQSFLNNEMAALWQAYFIDRTVQEKLEQLFGTEPDHSVVQLLAKQLGSLSEDDIRASLGRGRIRFDYSIQPLSTIVPPVLTTAVPTISDPPHIVATDDGRAEVSLRRLIDAGLIQPPMHLERSYKGQRLAARVDANGTVTFGETTFSSLSMAGRAARISVAGLSITANTNGWSFWKFKDADNKLKEMDVLRQRYLASIGH